MDLSGFAPISPEKRVFVLTAQWWKKISSNKDGTKKGLDWLKIDRCDQTFDHVPYPEKMREKSIEKKKSRQIEMGQKKDWTYKIDRSDQTVDHVTFGEKTRKNMSLKVRKSQNIFFLSSIPSFNQWKKFKLPNWLNQKKQFIMLNSSHLRKFNHFLEERAEIREKNRHFLGVSN